MSGTETGTTGMGERGERSMSDDDTFRQAPGGANVPALNIWNKR